MDKKSNFDIVSKKNLFIAIPAVLLAVLIAAGLIFGAEVSIEFTGGTILTYAYEGELNSAAVSLAVLNVGYTSTVTTGSAYNSDLQLLTVTFSTTEGLSMDEQAAVTAQLQEEFAGNNIKLENNQNVSATTGARFFLKCLVAFVFSFIMFVIYIALRFKKIGGWSTGIFALLGLLIDVIVVVSAFIFFRLPIDSIFMAVILTIMGYSINNTIIIYDRVRENKTLYGTSKTSRELVNMSVRQSVTRTINTTVTTAAALVVLSIVAVLYNVDTILNFAFPLLIGLVSGVYTSLCLSGTFWVLWQEQKLKRKKA